MNVGYFDYQYQELILNNAYLKTVLQEADYQDLNGENATCNMGSEYTTETYGDEEFKVYTFSNLDSMRIFYIAGENLYSLYDGDGFYFICPKQYAEEIAGNNRILKTENICRIAEKDGKYFMIISPSYPSYTGTVDTQGEWLSLKAATGFTFLEGKTYNIQVQNSAYLRIGKAVFYFGNEKFDYKATGSNLSIKTDYTPCVLSILEVGTVIEDGLQKGSFDKASQTLTLYNEYIIKLIYGTTIPGEFKELMLQAIGNKDIVFNFNDLVLYPGTQDKYGCYAKDIEVQGQPLCIVLDMSGGSYSITITEGVACLNDVGLSLLGITLDQILDLGGNYDENAFTITGTQGNYDVTFN